MKTLSLDLRERSLASYAGGEGPREEIAARYRVSLGMVKKLLQQRRHTGEIGQRHHRSGRKPKMRAAHHRRRRSLLGGKPDLTLKERRRALELECSLPAIHYALAALGLTYKKRRSMPASRRGPPSRKPAGSGAGGRAASTPRGSSSFDESGAKTNLTRLRGRAPRGERVVAGAPHGHWHTTTMIASLRRDGTTACRASEGATDTEVFRASVRRVLCPVLRTGDIVIMANLSPHKNEVTVSLIEAAGAAVRFLPASSPDLNPIEKMWSKVQQSLRGAEARTREKLLEAIPAAVQTVTPKDARGWFASCGYSFI